MTSLKTVLLGGAFSLAALSSAHAGYVSIDEFSGPNQTIQEHNVGTYELLDNAPSFGFATPANSIIGQYRDMKLEVLATPMNPNLESTSSAFFMMGVGSFTHNQDTGVASRSTLTYNGLSGAGLNFDASGLGGIAIGVNYSDLGLTWVLDLVDGTGKHATKEFATTSIASLTEVIQAFGTFTVEAGFDWTDIDIIAFIANKNGVLSLDTEVDYIRAVPEPATLALFGAGLLGLGMLRRRKAA